MAKKQMKESKKSPTPEELRAYSEDQRQTFVEKIQSLCDDEKFDQAKELIGNALMAWPENEDLHEQNITIQRALLGKKPQPSMILPFLDAYDSAVEHAQGDQKEYLAVNRCHAFFVEWEKVEQELKGYQPGRTTDPEPQVPGIIQRLFSYVDAVKAVGGVDNQVEVADALGQFLLDIAHNEEAIQAFSRVVSLKPDYYLPYIRMGEAYKNMGKFPQALGQLKKVPDSYSLVNERIKVEARVYARMGEKRKAIECLKKIGIESMGMGAKGKMREDPDFQSLWKDPEFVKMTR